MLIMIVVWKVIKKTKLVPLDEMDLVTDVHTIEEEEKSDEPTGWKGKAKSALSWLI